MKKKLTIKENLLVGSLLFGLFFGAGNLIFPVEIGQDAGYEIYTTMIGFLISAVGLPVLGVLAVVLSESENLYDMALVPGREFSLTFTSILYLTVGPFFAIPRTATVAYESGVKAFFPEGNQYLYLFIFSLIFFSLVLYFSLKPGKILDYIGKYLTPIFLVLIFILILFSMIRPMGDIGNFLPQEKYRDIPFQRGFIDGYNTMDTLSSLAYSITVISSIKSLGVNSTGDLARETLKSGIFCILSMSLVYLSLSFMASSSMNVMERGENGGLILSNIADYYFGNFGKILLAAIVFVACLKTAIGLISSTASMFTRLFSERFSYRTLAFIFSLISFFIANLGLNRIISLSLPVLMFIYPLSMVLISLSIFSVFMGKVRGVYRISLFVTGIFSFLDLLNSLPEFLKEGRIVGPLIDLASALPGFDLGFTWLLPALVSFLIACFIYRKEIRKNRLK